MKNRIVLLSFLVVFSSPYIFAQVLYLYKENLAINTINKGTLLETSKLSENILVEDEFQNLFKLADATGKWLVLSCNNNIEIKSDLIKIKQILHKENQRIKLGFSKDIIHPFDRNDIIIVDPLGNQVLKYSSTDNKTGIIKDLQRLLKYSYAG